MGSSELMAAMLKMDELLFEVAGLEDVTLGLVALLWKRKDFKGIMTQQKASTEKDHHGGKEARADTLSKTASTALGGKYVRTGEADAEAAATG